MIITIANNDENPWLASINENCCIWMIAKYKNGKYDIHIIKSKYIHLNLFSINVHIASA